jgi:hypothetical protein
MYPGMARLAVKKIPTENAYSFALRFIGGILLDE